MMGESDTNANPLNAIGMALSGGGTRAVGFHIGTLEYLHRLGMLKNVSMISAASGGSFVAAKYSLLLADYLRDKKLNPERDQGWEKAFDEFFNLFFREFYGDLRDIKFIEFASQTIGLPRKVDDGYVIPSGRYTLASAAADLYAQTFLKSSWSGKTYLFRDMCQVPEGYPLKNVIINSTDYQNCVAFRFAGNPQAEIGNVYLYEDYQGDERNIHATVRRECQNVRIADIIGSSSCIPPLYEPIGFPDDFAWPEGRIPDGVGKLCSWTGEGKRRKPRPVPLMDGGLYDNQGIESLVLADRGKDLKEMDYLLHAQEWEADEGHCGKGKKQSSHLDLFIVSDADREDKKENKFEYNKKRERRQFGNHSEGLSLGNVALAALAVGFLTETLLVVALVEIGRDILNSLREGSVNWFLCLAAAVHLFFVSAIAYGVWRLFLLGKKVLKSLSQTPQVGKSILKTILRLRLYWLWDGFRFRFFSVLETIFDVLLKRTRDLEYDVFYTDSHYNNRRISNMLYQLRPGMQETVLPGAEGEWDKVEHLFSITPKLALFVQRANDVATRFWFLKEKPWEQQSLVASGQATICYNMARFIVRNYGGEPDRYPRSIKRIWQKTVEDWKNLNKDPYSLLRERFEITGIDDELIEPPPYDRDAHTEE